MRAKAKKLSQSSRENARSRIDKNAGTSTEPKPESRLRTFFKHGYIDFGGSSSGGGAASHGSSDVSSGSHSGSYGGGHGGGSKLLDLLSGI